MDTDTILTLEHLKNWTFTGTPLAVLGFPIHHSISPAMHNAALAEMAKTHPELSDWQYFRFEVHPDELPQALKTLHQHNFLGINLTLPHKIIAFKEIDHIDATAQPIGAINTLRWTPQGYEGFNTDGYGLEHGLREDLQATLENAHVILLGAGG
ncbi:MAG: shikimate dehydrogenase, partial [Opitutaceae bacterium]|nr:shikimate dehydrogenase [Opitutaceae bacterium]